MNDVVREVVESLDMGKSTVNAITLLDSLSANPKICDEINRDTSQLLIFKTLSDTRNEKTLLKPV